MPRFPGIGIPRPGPRPSSDPERDEALQQALAMTGRTLSQYAQPTISAINQFRAPPRAPASTANGAAQVATPVGQAGAQAGPGSPIGPGAGTQAGLMGAQLAADLVQGQKELTPEAETVKSWAPLAGLAATFVPFVGPLLGPLVGSSGVFASMFGGKKPAPPPPFDAAPSPIGMRQRRSVY